MAKKKKKKDNSQAPCFYFIKLTFEAISQKRRALSVKITSEIL